MKSCCLIYAPWLNVLNMKYLIVYEKSDKATD